MPIEKNSEENISNDTEAYYEAVASQEEIYLEEVQEELRTILIFGDPSPSPKETERSLSNDPRCAANLDEQLDHAAHELITGDSDDPPLSEDTVDEMLRMAQTIKGF